MDQPITLTAASDLSAAAGYADEWRELLRRTPLTAAYQSPDWVLTWFRMIGTDDAPHIVFARRGDRLVGVAPFAITTIGVPGMRADVMISAATEPGDYGDPLLAADDADAVASAIAAHVRDWMGDGRRAAAIRRVERGAAFERSISALEGVTCLQTSEATSPVTRFGDWADPESEVERLAKELKLPKYERRAEREIAPLEFEDRMDPATCIERLAALHRARFGPDEAPKLLRLERSASFMIAAFRAMDADGLARTCRLSAGDQTIAIELGHNVGSRWIGQAAGFDPEHGRLRPGYLLVHQILRAAMREGAQEYDHGQGVQPYKTHWSTRDRHTRSVVLTPSGLRGRPLQLAQRLVARNRARQIMGDTEAASS